MSCSLFMVISHWWTGRVPVLCVFISFHARLAWAPPAAAVTAPHHSAAFHLILSLGFEEGQAPLGKNKYPKPKHKSFKSRPPLQCAPTGQRPQTFRSKGTQVRIGWSTCSIDYIHPAQKLWKNSMQAWQFNLKKSQSYFPPEIKDLACLWQSFSKFKDYTEGLERA